MILMVGTMFLTMRQYFGEPIECLSKSTDISIALLQVSDKVYLTLSSLPEKNLN